MMKVEHYLNLNGKLPEFTSGCIGSRIERVLVLSYCFIFVLSTHCLYLPFLWSLYYLSFDLQLLITPFDIFNNLFSKNNNVDKRIIVIYMTYQSVCRPKLWNITV